MAVAAAPEGSARNSKQSEAHMWRRWALFVVIGMVLYLGLYAWSEWLVYGYGQKNRFFMIRTVPPQHYDFVILGASHAMPFDFEDINERLEDASESKIVNLSTEGSGILPNRLLLEYFLARHTAGHLIFFLDSFAFYSAQWNEARLDDGMLRRAPLDPALVMTLWRHKWARNALPAYVSGFAKINNELRFAPDIPESEMTKFERTYRPITQIDRRRVQFLYPAEPDPTVFRHYLDVFESLVRFAGEQGTEVVVVKPPTPPRYRERLPNEAAFDAAVGNLTARLGVAFHDFSDAITDDRFYYDTDHLNRDGVLSFIDDHFAELLRDSL